jgi:hypothetical protein
MTEEGDGLAEGPLAVLSDAVVWVCVLPPGVVRVVVVREDSAPDMSARSVSAMRTASALRRNTT